MKKLGYLLFLIILITVVLYCFVGCEIFNSKEPEIVDVDHQVDSKTWLQLMD